jgi:hypothetical protein
MQLCDSLDVGTHAALREALPGIALIPVATLGAVEPEPTAAPAPPKRRLSDKLMDCLQQAARQGRSDTSERLRLCHQSLRDEEAHYDSSRRSGGRGAH